MTKKKESKSSRPSKESMLMEWTFLAAERATCKRLKVGSLIASKDLRRILGYGYNGNYSGGPNKCDNETPGVCGCVHSEINSLIQSNKEAGMIMFVTDSPCLNCAKGILNSGIEILYYRREYRNQEGLSLLRSKIKVIKI